jgi:DnaJ domain
MSEPDLRYPLHYPVNWKRTQHPRSSRFDPTKTRTFAQARDELYRQLNLLGASKIILSTDIPLRKDGLPYSTTKRVNDPGAAVYFHLNKTPMVLACDAWDRVIDNVWAIAQHIDALRAQQRYGVGTLEQAFMGYQALPPSATADAWWVVLGVSSIATANEIKEAYRKAAKTAHPDQGGDRVRWDKIQHAYQQAMEANQ